MKILGFFLSLLLLLGAVAAAGVLAIFWHFGQDVPDHRRLANYSPETTTRVYAADGRLIAEYAREKRAFMQFEEFPPRLVEAFLSAEDKTFYEHMGVDVPSILRAAATNVKNLGTGRRPVGASTITQQVAKNFLLTDEVSVARKVKEAILAIRIEQTFSKNHILELYLNEIYLGFQAYGVAAASLHYFDKKPDELSLAEMAFLAALPKAPNNYNPYTHHGAAVGRRNWVLDQMADNGFITPTEAARAKSASLRVVKREEQEAVVTAPFFAEEVRRELAERYNFDVLYGGGLTVRATMDPKLQELAQQELRDGLVAYDRRHGYRGPVERIATNGDWQSRLNQVERPAGLDPWDLGVVLKVSGNYAIIGLPDGKEGMVPFSTMTWARKWYKGQRVGGRPRNAYQVVKAGDVIVVAAMREGNAAPDDTDAPMRTDNSGRPMYSFKQIPDVEGALVALDPHTGRVLALAGGWSFDESEFNRATQALRQPGSSFKPFVYLTALENGFTPSSIINDAPIVISRGPGRAPWRPKNYSGRTYGPSTMRIGLERSRNLMTIRLARAVSMPKIMETARKFGVFPDEDQRPPDLAMSLGARETTVLRITAAFGMLVNGGKKITPSLIDSIQGRDGKVIYRHDTRDCPHCTASEWFNQDVPHLEDNREQLVRPASAYQIVSMLQGVVQRGTARTVTAVGKPVAGKTGTTNDAKDAWFVGFSPNLVAGVFVGFDDPKSLGPREAGGRVAVPIFRDFMKKALRDQPGVPFRVPSDVRLVRVGHASGKPGGGGKTILEAFRVGTSWKSNRTNLGKEIAAAPKQTATSAPKRSSTPSAPKRQPVPDLGGLY